MRLYDPTQGRILWDGSADAQALRQRLGALFQDFSHDDLSVQKNIGSGKIARKAGLAGRIAAAGFSKHAHSHWLAAEEGVLIWRAASGKGLRCPGCSCARRIC